MTKGITIIKIQIWRTIYGSPFRSNWISLVCVIYCHMCWNTIREDTHNFHIMLISSTSLDHSSVNSNFEQLYRSGNFQTYRCWFVWSCRCERSRRESLPIKKSLCVWCVETFTHPLFNMSYVDIDLIYMSIIKPWQPLSQVSFPHLLFFFYFFI